MTKHGSKAPKAPRRVLLEHAGFQLLTPNQRNALISPAVVEEAKYLRGLKDDACISADDDWYHFVVTRQAGGQAATGTQQRRLQQLSQFDAAVGASMVRVALIRYGWSVDAVGGKGATVQPIARTGGVFTFRAVQRRAAAGGSGGDGMGAVNCGKVYKSVTDAVKAVYGVCLARSRGRSKRSAGTGKKRKAEK
jgi:hypothetical protein